MCGRATFATEVSSTSMKVASITEPAMSHGLWLGCQWLGVASGELMDQVFAGGVSASVLARARAAERKPSHAASRAMSIATMTSSQLGTLKFFTCTEGITDKPGPSTSREPGGWLKTIFTGTRCTTLT